MTEYLELNHVMAMHETLINQYGGSHGIRDKGLLESAIAQPEQNVFGQDLFPTLFDKAAAYAYYLSKHRPFLDGNKRTAASSAHVFLDINGYEVSCPEGGIYKVMMDVFNKRLTKKKLANWFKKNSKTKKKRKK